MKRWLIGFGLVAMLCSNACALEWLTDLPTALDRARQEDKVVLLDFTGSDWCRWCQKLKAEVFDQAEFAAYAAANLVLVEVDFPRRKNLGSEQLHANRALASKYGVPGYPTIILLNSDGQKLGAGGYVAGGPPAFLARIEKFRARAHQGESPVGAQTDSPGDSVRPSRPKAPPQVLVAPPPLKYGEITLKGVSGVGRRRLALINNESLMAGESAKVKSFGTNVEVTVKEIRDASVLVVVRGQTRELSLAHPPGKP
jgi:thioredoxin-related protein